MNYESAERFILNKLRNELPKHLSYHSIYHVKDVLSATINIAKQEGVNGEELILLKTAAAFHDSGFLFGAKDHELKSCEIARLYLPDYGYNPEEIERICGMIMATKIPQQPTNHLEEILADADLDYLGREDFFSISNQLFDELTMVGLVYNEDDWNQLQVKFFDSHHYFTATAIRLRNQKKQEHLQIIKSKLNHK
ncbi:MAG TPA: phosphohydrolase [Edaphocola sp.]|nr:phosphohydrolase [Edaphocola sp.]